MRGRRSTPRKRAARGPRRAALTPRGRTSEAVRAWLRFLEVHKGALAELRGDIERDVSLARFDLLALLSREDGQTLASLARRLLVTAGNITGLVDRAARDGIVERRASPSDRRATHVFLTPAGARLFRRLERRRARRVRAMFAGLSGAELLQLTTLLGKVRARLRGREGEAAVAARETTHAPRSGRARGERS